MISKPLSLSHLASAFFLTPGWLQWWAGIITISAATFSSSLEVSASLLPSAGGLSPTAPTFSVAVPTWQMPSVSTLWDFISTGFCALQLAAGRLAGTHIGTWTLQLQLLPQPVSRKSLSSPSRALPTPAWEQSATPNPSAIHPLQQNPSKKTLSTYNIQTNNTTTQSSPTDSLSISCSDGTAHFAHSGRKLKQASVEAEEPSMKINSGRDPVHEDMADSKQPIQKQASTLGNRFDNCLGCWGCDLRVR